MQEDEPILKPKRNIQGNALRVYAFLFIRGNETTGVREVQRALGFSSPSSAIFQLDKLVDLDFAQKDNYGRYQVSRREKIGDLVYFVVIRSSWVPLMMVYAVIVTALSVSSVVLLSIYGAPQSLLAVVPSIIASWLMWVEAKKLWKSRPVFAWPDGREIPK